MYRFKFQGLRQLWPTRGVPVDCFVQPSLSFCCSISSLYILTTCHYFDNLKFEIFGTGGPQCHFITSVLDARGFPHHMSTDTLEQNFLLVF